MRHTARLFVAAASLSVPWLTVVLRKGYGLVIDPAQTRAVLLRSLRSLPAPAVRQRRYIDTW